MLTQMAVGLIKYRTAFLVGIIVVTGFFAYQALSVDFLTDFNDLLPHGHPYVQIHKKYRDRFGGANITTIVLEVKDGDIYNMKTLQKLQNINKAMYYIPNINNLQVTSIADRKVKNIVSDAEGLYRSAVMWPMLPKSEEDLQKLKETILGNGAIYGQYVSLNNKMLLLYADFWEKAIDYRVIFKKLREVVEKESDENHIVHMAGEPVLYGWVYHYFPQMVRIFMLTMLVVLVLLFIYIRTVRGMLLPIIACLVSAAWGMGFANLLGYNFDPLIMVIPILLSAMVISHGVQMVMRYDQEAPKAKDSKLAAEKCFYALFAPGALSIITDAAALSIVIITPIPLMKKLAIMGTFWVLSFYVSVLILLPILLSYLPIPKVKSDEEQRAGFLERILRGIGESFFGKGKYVVVAVTFVVLIWAVYNSQFLTVGDPKPGSPILWPDSTYNNDVKTIDSNFPGTNQMYIVFDAKPQFKDTEKKTGAEMVCKRPNVLRKFSDFQRYLESLPEIGLTLSLADLIPGLNMKLMADNPRWEQLPIDRDHSGELFQMLMAGSDPGDLDRFTNYDYTEASVIMYFKNRTGDTLRKVIGKCREWIKDPQNKLEEGDFMLAGGVVAVIAAINETILYNQTLSIVLALGFVFLTCCITYRSLFAGFLFMVPLAICNFLTFAYMAFKGIGLNINVLPVASMGIGMGVDYGIYIVSRIRDEYHESKDFKLAIVTAMATSGRSVLYTASTLVAGTIFWYFLSDLRFQAEMGLMLALWMFMAMLAGMILVPMLVAWFKPGFVTKARGIFE
ncbi:MAG: MMPL family transporter [Pseudomonadota bacterium]